MPKTASKKLPPSGKTGAKSASSAASLSATLPASAAASSSASLPPARRATSFAWRRYLWLAAGAAAIVWAMVALQAILTPFIAGALLAYLGSPFVARLSGGGGAGGATVKKRFALSRTAGTLLVMLVLSVFCALLIFLTVPLVRSEVAAIQSRLPALWQNFIENRLPLIEAWLGVSLTPNIETLRQFAAEHVGDFSSVSLTALSGLKNSGALFLSLAINTILIPVVMFYLLRDGHLLVDELYKLIPPRFVGKTTEIAREINEVLSQFIRGQATVMLILAVYYGAALKLAGLDFAWSIGLLTGLLVFIPYVGFTLGFVLALFTALLQLGDTTTLLLCVVGIYAAGQLIEGYILVPYLIGDKIGLHPLAVIFALLAFGELFGFVGLLAALPLAAVVLIALRHLRAAYMFQVSEDK